MQNHYVYLHRKLSDNVVFYVGKGNASSNRAYDKAVKRRSKKWNDLVRLEGGFNVEILNENMTESDALDLETMLINNPKEDWQLINVAKSSKIIEIPSNISDFVYYDQTSKSALRWKCARGRAIKTGSEVGTLTRSGYWAFEFNGISYLVHRVVMHLHGKIINNLLVNHINNSRSDNRFENLELVSHLENNRKKSHNNNNTLYPHNKSGINGIWERSFHKGKYQAVIVGYTEKGKRKEKVFMYTKCGKETAWEMAIIFRKELENSWLHN